MTAKEKQCNSFIYKLQNIVLILILFLPCISFSQELTLDYIFQDTNIVNPRPSLKFINQQTSKIYYYADENYDGMLSLFDMNYNTGESFKYSDSGETASEFILKTNGDAVTIINGDLFITKNFTASREFTKDIKLTETDKYEYSPLAISNFVVYRRAGNYFLIRYDSLKKNSVELALTNDESDSISYQIIEITDKYADEPDCVLRLFIARYDNSSKTPILIPDYNSTFVKTERRKRGISNVNLLEYAVYTIGKDSLFCKINEIIYPSNIRYSTAYADYSSDGRNLLLDAETLDRHERKLFICNIKSKAIKEIYTESDAAWFERHSNPTVFLDSSTIFFESEVSGFNNLYSINLDGSGFTKLAGGNYTITESAIDHTNKMIYFSANAELPYNYNLYSLNFDGTGFKKLTNSDGDIQELKLTQGGSVIFFTHSYITQPNELYSFTVSSGNVKQLTNSISPKFTEVNWNLPELITFNNKEDGQLIYGFVYKPLNFNPKKKYPLICFVHGAGYLQNVTNGFSPYRDNFMVDTYLTQKDFIILDIDFRGSMGYGKDFRNKTYRNLGYWEVSDYISGIEFLDSKGWIDINNIGIYGGSYGGFVTLMAMFKHPELFKAGVSLRAVSNWKNYYYSNWWFTLARLGNPDSTGVSEFYEQSSPITFSQNLQGHLLMTHGMLDDNVFFQDMVQLTQKLIDNKKDFEVMFYPKESHSFYRQTSWLDQYKRIYNCFEKYLK